VSSGCTVSYTNAEYDEEVTGIRGGDAERVCCVPKAKLGLGRYIVEQILVLVWFWIVEHSIADR
jgi:hypothetical protein